MSDYSIDKSFVLFKKVKLSVNLFYSIDNYQNSRKARDLAKRILCFYAAINLSCGFPNIALCADVSFPEPHKLDAGVSIEHSDNLYRIKHQGASGQVFDNEWNSFNVPAAGTVDFYFSSSGQISINRVIGNQASQILGRITESGAGGKVFLINPHGVLFGHGASVNLGSLVVSTAEMTSRNLDKMEFVFQQGENTGSIINEGQIKVSDTGFLTMMAPVVENRGIIETKKGTVALVSGGKYTLTMEDGNEIKIKTDEKLTNKLIKDKEASILINNSGEIHADGGEVLLSADAAEDIIANAVNHTGIIKANTVQEVNGEIVFGDVKLLGEEVIVDSSAKIDVSGEGGGGQVLIGGDYQGQGDTKTAKHTYIGKDVKINADAKQNGDGGKVIVWSDEATHFHGNISAKGGSESGDGGFVEVSGKKLLAYYGDVDVTAPNGATGKLLLDPENWLITNAFDSTGLVLWLDGEDDSTINLNGNKVTNWNDKSGRNNDAKQSNSNYQPTYDSDENSVNFEDGDRLEIGNTNDINTSSYNEKTHFVVFKTPSVLNQNRMIFEEGGNVNTMLFYLENNQLYIGYSNGNAPQYFGNFTVEPDTVYVGGFVLNTADKHIASLNGITKSGAKNITLKSHSGKISIGAAEANNRLHDGASVKYTKVVPDIYEVIQYGKTALDDNQREFMEAYLGSKWGVEVDNSYTGTSVMTQDRLERISQTADVALQADNNIIIDDLTNNLLNLTRGLTLTADADGNNSGSIIMNDFNDLIKTEGGQLNFSGASLALGNLNTSGVAGNLGADIILDADNGSVAVKNVNSGTGKIKITSTDDFLADTGTLLASQAAGDSIVVASTAGSFINEVGSGLFSNAADGRWLVYSDNPANTDENGLTYSKHYGISYNDNIDDYDSGNYIFYSEQPKLTLQAQDKTRTYGDSNPEFTYTYDIGDLIDGDDFLQAISDNLPYQTDAVEQSDVISGGYSIYKKSDLFSPLGYELDIKPGTLTITPKPLVTSLIGEVEKVYDGNISAAIAENNFNRTGILEEDDIDFTYTTGRYNNKNAGENKTVFVEGLNISGDDAANYDLDLTELSSAIGKITPKELIAALTGKVSKIYDGTDKATLKLNNYNLTGVINGDSVNLSNYTTGNYDDEKVGKDKIVYVKDLALSGDDSANYNLASANLNDNIGEITPKPEEKTSESLTKNPSVKRAESVQYQNMHRVAKDSQNSNYFVKKSEDLIVGTEKIPEKSEPSQKIVEVKYKKSEKPAGNEKNTNNNQASSNEIKTYTIKKVPKDYDTSVFKLITTIF